MTTTSYNCQASSELIMVVTGEAFEKFKKEMARSRCSVY